MKKTLVAKLLDRMKEMNSAKLELATGGIQTITNCGGKCDTHVESDGPPPQ